MPRQPKGRPSIYKGADGQHHTYLTIGTKPDGSPLRKHIKRSSAEGVAAEIDEVLKRVKQGAGKLAKIETVEQWLDHWIQVVLKSKRDSGNLAHSTFADYSMICRLYLVPHLGQWRLTGSRRRLEPEHLEAMYAKLNAKGMASSYVVRVHRIAVLAFKLAYRRGRADRNVMELVEAPEYRAKKVQALSQVDATKVLGVALQDDLAARWGLGILAGPRQGEVLGIRWPAVELDPDPGEEPHVKLLKQVRRRTWEHGCPDPVACVKSRVDGRGKPVSPCRTKPCPPLYAHGCGGACGKKLARYCPQARVAGACLVHRDKDGGDKECPPLCKPDCTSHASTCERRTGGGLVESDLKTHASEAPLSLGAVVTELFRRHRERQIQLGSFDANGFVFPGSAGKAMDPRRDYENWRDLLKRAGVKHHRLHAARHTAGTFLRATGSDLREIQEILRHADMAMSGRYIDVAMQARADAVDRVAAALIEGDLGKIMGAKRVA